MYNSPRYMFFLFFLQITSILRVLRFIKTIFIGKFFNIFGVVMFNEGLQIVIGFKSFNLIGKGSIRSIPTCRYNFERIFQKFIKNDSSC